MKTNGWTENQTRYSCFHESARCSNWQAILEPISMVQIAQNLILHPYIVPYMFTYGHIQETVFIIDINNSHKRELK